MKIGIAVFSGTGNTAHVAGLLATELGSLGATVDTYDIDLSHNRQQDNDNQTGIGLQNYDHHDIEATRRNAENFDPRNYDLIGIGHPVLGFGPTPLVVQFVKSLPEGKGRVFIFKSAGDNHRINNSASEELIQILESKGYEIIHDFLYVMPCNWIFAYTRPFNLQIVDKAQEKAVQHAKELISDTRSYIRAYKWWRLTAKILHYLESNYGRKQFGKSMYASKDCIQCGRCIDNCPANNIRDEKHAIRFGENCLWCMRCVYSCPKRAIYAKGMNWCIIKNGYRLKDYIGTTDADRTFITRESRGYWKHFIEYFM